MSFPPRVVGDKRRLDTLIRGQIAVPQAVVAQDQVVIRSTPNRVGVGTTKDDVFLNAPEILSGPPNSGSITSNRSAVNGSPSRTK